MGKEILPVSARMVNYEKMSSLSREEFKADVGADAGGYFALGVVLYLEVVLSEGGGTLILGGRGSTLKELKALDTFVIVMTW